MTDTTEMGPNPASGESYRPPTVLHIGNADLNAPGKAVGRTTPRRVRGERRRTLRRPASHRPRVATM